MADREFKGGAVATTLTGLIDGAVTTIPISASTGWPTGTGTDTFVAVINRGQADEEKVLFDSRSANVLTAASTGRGYDGTAAQSHAAGATIEHCVDATWFQEINEHYNDTTLDHHTQYLNPARHDLATRHQFGAALGTPPAPADVASAASAGAGAVPARSDHVHKIAPGTITATELAPGAINSASIVDGTIMNVDVNAAAAIATTKLSPDPLARANHTGTQLAATVSDFTEAAQDAVGAAAVSGAFVNLTYSDAANTLMADMVAGWRPHKIVTSGTRPSGSPGDIVTETDTNQVTFQNSAGQWVWTLPVAALVATVEGTTNSAYAALASNGPSVTVLTGTKAIVTISANLSTSAGALTCNAAVAVSGATSAAAIDTRGFAVTISSGLGWPETGVKTVYITGLTPGLNTFTMQYRRSNGADTAYFADRSIHVQAIP